VVARSLNPGIPDGYWKNVKFQTLTHIFHYRRNNAIIETNILYTGPEVSERARRTHSS
jgi:hypothetical protein